MRHRQWAPGRVPVWEKGGAREREAQGIGGRRGGAPRAGRGSAGHFSAPCRPRLARVAAPRLPQAGSLSLSLSLSQAGSLSAPFLRLPSPRQIGLRYARTGVPGGLQGRTCGAQAFPVWSWGSSWSPAVIPRFITQFFSTVHTGAEPNW